MDKPINVLISAYAVSPDWGSEPGMGWNWIVNLARYCNLHVITEGEWRNEIEKAVAALPQRDHLHFYYNPLPEKVRRMCWNQGDWRFYWYYRKWQRKTLCIAESICREQRIDILHQLNMIGFREPGLLWKIPHIPFVWGPMGGMSIYDPSYIKDAPFRMRCAVNLKYLINDWQRKKAPRVVKAIERAAAIVTATKDTRDFIRSYHKKNAILINETGCYERSVERKESHFGGLNLIWIGRFLFTKQLGLALQTMALLKHYPSVKLHIVGAGSPAEETYYRNMAKSLGLADSVVWHGKVAHERVFELMNEADLLFFSSIAEGTPHVILEAIQNNLPVLCFDVCGQGDVIDETVGIKIPMSDLTSDARRFADIIGELAEDKSRLQVLSANCLKRQHDLSWEVKIGKMVEIYESCLKKA